MNLTKAELENVARLARLELNESEKEEFTGQINKLLQYIEKLNQLDTTGIEPLAQVIPVTNIFRSDEVKQSLNPELALQNAPVRKDNFFKVPKVLEDSKS